MGPSPGATSRHGVAMNAGAGGSSSCGQRVRVYASEGLWISRLSSPMFPSPCDALATPAGSCMVLALSLTEQHPAPCVCLALMFRNIMCDRFSSLIVTPWKLHAFQACLYRHMLSSHHKPLPEVNNPGVSHGSSRSSPTRGVSHLRYSRCHAWLVLGPESHMLAAGSHHSYPWVLTPA